MPEALIAATLGTFTGALMGLTGAGGGVVASPLLMLALHLSLGRSAPVALIAVVLGAGLAVYLGLREGVVRWRAAFLMAAAGLLASPLGIRLSMSLPEKPLALAFSLLLFWQAQRQWRHRSLARDAAPPCVVDGATGRFRWTQPCARALAGAGLLSGFLSGLLGVGGGFILVPALRRHTDLSMHAATATALMVLALVSSGGAALWIAHGGIDAHLAAAFAGGTVAGILLGRRASPRLPERRLQQLFAATCLLVGLGLAAKTLLR